MHGYTSSVDVAYKDEQHMAHPSPIPVETILDPSLITTKTPPNTPSQNDIQGRINRSHPETSPAL